jgi:formylglycine-generating enzyme required for sulfatase activity
VCPDHDTLTRLLDEGLDDDSTRRVEGHVETCARCQGRLDELTARSGWPWFLPDVSEPRPAEGAGARPVPLGSAEPSRPEFPGFRILDELGHGGYGVVYRAVQSDLGRVVALKVLKHGRFASPPERSRFQHEARAAAQLQHPHIVPIYSVGEADGVLYFVMECLEGGTLAQRLDGTPQPPRAASELVATLARATYAAHGHAVVHRDLKPANVLLSRDGTPKITDFGIAKLETTDGQTPTVAVLGTPSYMAPEQASGSSRNVGPAADIYALGAILYELLTGRPPFRAETPWETLVQVTEHEPVSPRQLQPKLPRDLEVICLKCLRKSPRDRYATALDLADDLGRFLAGEPIRARPAGRLERIWKWARQDPTTAVAAVVSLLAVLAAAFSGGYWYHVGARQSELRTRAETLVHSLSSIETARVPDLLAQLESCRREAGPLLRARLQTAAADSKDRLHLSLALLPADPTQIDHLLSRMLIATPDEFLVIRDALRGLSNRVLPRLWPELDDASAPVSGRAFRAACALAGYEPRHPAWSRLANRLTTALVAENPVWVGQWVEALRPIGTRLVEPLAAMCGDASRSDGERYIAATVLLEYAADRPGTLADAACRGDSHQVAVLLPALRQHPARAASTLRRMLETELAAGATDSERDAFALRRAQAAALLLHLGETEPVWPLLRLEPDPRLRTMLIHRLALLDVAPDLLVRGFRTERDDSVRRSVVLALGEYAEARFPPALRQEVTQELLQAYRSDPDPGLHSAIDWLLGRRWGQRESLDRIDGELAGRPRGDSRWVVNPAGDTFAILPRAAETVIGSPDTEPRREHIEWQRACRIPHSFAIATREVTRAQFQRFLEDYPGQPFDLLEDPLPADDRPVRGVSIVVAMRYCRWLGEREGIAAGEQVYPPVDEITPALTLTPRHLQRTGYRLPTHIEWEHACRAGTATARFSGATETLLDRYACYLQNSGEQTFPAGSLKPNDAGLFDMLGNVWECCQPDIGTHAIPPAPNFDADRPIAVFGRDAGITKGGSYLYLGGLVRSARRYQISPVGEDSTVGFRVVRTMRGHSTVGR